MSSDVVENQLKDTVRQLGKTLGTTIKDQLGEEWLERIEKIRKSGRKSNNGDQNATQLIQAEFASLNNDQLLTVARAFTQFLNLANIAEQEDNSRAQVDDPMEKLLSKLGGMDFSNDSFASAVAKLDIDLVLTAHPTEVYRRTFIHKYSELNECIASLRHGMLNDAQRKSLELRIADLITQAWHSEEVRAVRPTPVDEAQWGFAVIENSLWEAVPDFIRELDSKIKAQFGEGLPLDASPVHFSSWMGGDRDGNPNVTAAVTQKVLLLARKRAARLFAGDIEDLVVELSMSDCDDNVCAMVGADVLEPYRALLRPVYRKLMNTHDGIEAFMANEPVDQDEWVRSNDEILSPLMACYDSLNNCGMGNIADSKLLDVIRRAHCFGVHLLSLDIRQDSERHADVFGEVTRYLGLGDYNSWSEADKQAFLLRELNSKRPLFPKCWEPSPEVKEVIDTCKVIADNNREAFGIYIISMASLPSDVMAVQLLLQEMNVSWPMSVAPLFETLDDLNNAPEVMTNLLAIDWYRGYIKGQQYVMIGYSDSAKDAGALAAGWAQYESQEALVKIAEENDVKLTLFHGRGGTIGRGGLPAHSAIRSQPPGSLDGGFRVTEQGETIRYKFGMPALAKRSLNLYASAILEAFVDPPPEPKAEWREAITKMAGDARDNYRNVVRHDPDFVPYFRVATPEQELGKLPLGSRPAKRKPTGGIESLRAIPWIFAWAQTRMVLPSWLGVMPAMQKALDEGMEPLLQDMISDWPFFASRLSMLDMVFYKADPKVGKAYDEKLVPDNLKHFGNKLRKELTDAMALLLKLSGQNEIMESDPKGKVSMSIRADYLQPLHYLQMELLDRIRLLAEDEEDKTLEKAMMVTITGIAVGMRNTG